MGKEKEGAGLLECESAHQLHLERLVQGAILAKRETTVFAFDLNLLLAKALGGPSQTPPDSRCHN